MMGDELPQGATLETHQHQLRPEYQRRVGLAAVRSNLEGLGGQTLSQIGVPRDQGPGRPHEELLPFEVWLLKPLGHDPHDLNGAVQLVEIPGPAHRDGPIDGGRVEKDRVAHPLRSDHGVRGPDERLFLE
jgi:hypothetical protein